MKFGVLAYTEILGLPIIGWGGLVSLILLLLTATIGFLNKRGIRMIPQKYHQPMAYLTVIVATFHGLLGMLSTLGY